MRFKKHSHLEGAHAFLSPSSYHWVNYDLPKLAFRWKTMQAAAMGTEEHRYAAIAIAEKEVQDNERTTLGLYINQCIAFRMTPEQLLYYSPNCFGTADAISYRYRVLRISDYKSGITPVKETQLEVYAAIFCLEYEISPFDMRDIELRIYQDGECRVYHADPERVQYIMDKIVEFDQEINKFRKEELK